MGTRNLTAVFHDGKYKVAQYGQWDGYPSGQGATALDFLQKITKRGMKKFIRRLNECEFIPQAEMETWETKYSGDGGNSRWLRDYPYVTRDHGAEVLDLIYSRDDKPRLKNSLECAGRSLSIEYGYVIDLDKGAFEVYHGFQHAPHTGERFSDFAIDETEFDERDKDYKPTGGKHKYHPIKLWRSYRLSRLPSKAYFLETADKPEEE